MDRSIPHVLDIFTSSPGERRRHMVKERETEKISSQLKEQQKNPGSDSAVSLGSSEDEEDERNISKYFDYLNDDDENSFNRRKKPSKVPAGKENPKEEIKPLKKMKEANERESRKSEFEKDIKQIERHLSMKKTIRKKMMRDLQQAFVENPGEFQQDPDRIPPEKKKNIDIQNLTISKKRMSKSEHSFLDMLKDSESNNKKDRKCSRGSDDLKIQKNLKQGSKEDLFDDDSGNDSPTREIARSKSKQDILETKENAKPKEEKKQSFWKRLTGKGKNKR